jgi:hypothetical protein
MNTLLIDAFLVDVVSEACASLQLQKANSQDLATEDVRVSACARTAYAMIVSYINRDLAKSAFTEYYFEEDTRFRLRNYPVSVIESVCFVDNPNSVDLTNTEISDPLVEDTDYTLRFGKDLVISKDAVAKSIGDSTKVHVLVEYQGGYEYSTDESNLHLALVMQTIALYNRLPALGISHLQGANSAGQMTIASSPDAGELLDSVKTILSPYVYYGAAEVA